MIWSRLLPLRPSQERDAAAALYRAVIAQAREPAFYARFGVPDSVDGRFEMIALHMFGLLHRLKQEPDAAALSQELFDIMFVDMDRSLREMGVGDLGVGRRVRAMAEGLYGRMAAYESGLAAGDAELAAAVRRNVYGTIADGAVPETALAGFCGYLRALVVDLGRQSRERLIAGDVTFIPVSSSA